MRQTLIKHLGHLFRADDRGLGVGFMATAWHAAVRAQAERCRIKGETLSATLLVLLVCSSLYGMQTYT